MPFDIWRPSIIKIARLYEGAMDAIKSYSHVAVGPILLNSIAGVGRNRAGDLGSRTGPTAAPRSGSMDIQHVRRRRPNFRLWRSGKTIRRRQPPGRAWLGMDRDTRLRGLLGRAGLDRRIGSYRGLLSRRRNLILSAHARGLGTCRFTVAVAENRQYQGRTRNSARARAGGRDLPWLSRTSSEPMPCATPPRIWPSTSVELIIVPQSSATTKSSSSIAAVSASTATSAPWVAYE